MGTLPLIYFPTTTFLIDDDPEFLAVLPLHLNERQYFKSFTSPYMALASLGVSDGMSMPYPRWLNYWKNTTPENPETLLHGVIYDPERFSDVSVVVVDYCLDEAMNGIDFCKKLNNPLVGKILLTGRNDEELAIEARNSGVIDRIIHKYEKDHPEQLDSAIIELQQRYFSRSLALVQDTLALPCFGFLQDPTFHKRVEALCTTFQPVEFHLCGSPTGLLMVDNSGAGRFLSMQTEADEAFEIPVAKAYGAWLKGQSLLAK